MQKELEQIYKKAKKSFLLRMASHIKIDSYYEIYLSEYQGVHSLKIKLHEFDYNYSKLELDFLNLFNDFKIKQEIQDDRVYIDLEIPYYSSLFEKYLIKVSNIKMTKSNLKFRFKSNKDVCWCRNRTINKILKVLEV